MYHSDITADAVASISIKFPIPGYPKYFADVDGNIYSTVRGPMNRMSPSVQKNGYLMLCLFVNRKPCWQYVHTLMALTFLGERPDGMVICHGPNPDKSDCRINNLRFDSRRNNAAEWIATGAAHGRPGGPKLDPDTVRAIRQEKVEKGVTNRSLADRYGVGLDAIRCVLNRTTWRHVV